WTPVDAPEGTPATPWEPSSRKTSASTVGLPRESMISRANTCMISATVASYANLGTNQICSRDKRNQGGGMHRNGPSVTSGFNCYTNFLFVTQRDQIHRSVMAEMGFLGAWGVTIGVTGRAESRLGRGFRSPVGAVRRRPPHHGH